MVDLCCPKCGRIHHVGEEHIGYLLKCAGCENIIPIVNQNNPYISPRATKNPGNPIPITPIRRNDWHGLSERMPIRLSKRTWIIVLVVAVCIGCVFYANEKIAATNIR